MDQDLYLVALLGFALGVALVCTIVLFSSETVKGFPRYPNPPAPPTGPINDIKLSIENSNKAKLALQKMSEKNSDGGSCIKCIGKCGSPCFKIIELGRGVKDIE